MKAKKKSPPRGLNRINSQAKADIEATLREIGNAYDWLAGTQHREQIPQPHRLLLLRILTALGKQEDPRITLGIPPRRGRPNNNAAFHWAIAAHYRQARKVDSLAKVSIGKVSDLWGISAAGVKKIVKANPASQDEREQYPLPQKTLEGLARAFKRRTPKVRN